LHAGRSLRRAYENPLDVEARDGMAYAALLSGIALTNAGLGAVHGFAAPLGAAFPVPHGVVCAALLAPVIAANVGALRGASAGGMLERYAAIGRAVRTADEGVGTTSADAIEGLIAFLQSLTTHLQIPRLGTYGITRADVPGIVALAQKASSMKFNPVVLPAETLGGILQGAL